MTQRETAVLVASDLHFGKSTPTYSPEVFMIRLGKLDTKLRRIRELLSSYDFDELVIALLGDANDGSDIYPTQVHYQEISNVEEQAALLADLLARFARRQAETWGKVRIEAVPGNHGRSGRFAHEAANWDITCYRYLEMLTRSDEAISVHFENPGRDPFLRVMNVYGHGYLIYHGHDIRCFPSGTMVYLSYGEQQAIESLTPGQYIMSAKGATVMVEQVHKYQHKGSLVVVEVTHLIKPAFKCTPEHKILTVKPQWIRDGIVPAPDWVPAKYLSVGDYVAVTKPKFDESLTEIRPADIPLHKKAHYKDRLLPDSIPIDEDLGLVLGWYLGDGSITNQDCIETVFHDSEHAWAKRYCDAVERICGIRPKIIAKPGRHAIRAMLYHKRLAAILLHLGARGSRQKRVHESVFHWSKAAIHAMLVGWLAADGYAYQIRGKYSYTSGTSMSPDLARGMFLVALGLGYHPGLTRTAVKYPGGARMVNEVGVYGDEATEIGLLAKVNFKPIKHLPQRASQVTWKETPDYYLLPISSCCQEAYDGEVFDLTVSQDGSYNANGVAVHNSFGQIPWYGMSLRAIRWSTAESLPAWSTLLMGHFHTFGSWQINRLSLRITGTMVSDDEWALRTLGWESQARWHLFGVSQRYPETWSYGLELG